MIDYDGRTTDYQRLRLRETCQLARSLDDEQKKRVLEEIQLRRLVCRIVGKHFNEKLLKSVERVLSEKGEKK